MHCSKVTQIKPCLVFFGFLLFFMVLSFYSHDHGIESNACVSHGRDQLTKDIDGAYSRHKSASKTRKRVLVTDEFLQAQAEFQRQRREQLEDTCNTLDFQMEQYQDVAPYDILVDKHHKIAYCTIPKIASTSWKRIWLVLTGLANSTDQYTQQVVNNDLIRNNITHLSDYSPSVIRRVLANYTKFMFSRHPLSRVLSAFRNKLAPDSSFILRDKWQRKMGWNILKRYRENPKYADLNYTLAHYDLTFTEFIRHITDMTDKKASFNKHWMEMYAQCRPCEIKYNFLGKYETLSADAKYILHMANVDHIVEFPSYNGSSPTNSSAIDTLISYYSEVPWPYIEKLLLRFSLDIRMFGYGPYPSSKPEFLEWLKRTAEVHV